MAWCMAMRKGSLEAGKDADVVVLNPEGSVRWTIARGRLAYDAEASV